MPGTPTSPMRRLAVAVALTLSLLACGCSLLQAIPGTIGGGLAPKTAEVAEPLSELDAEGAETPEGPSASEVPLVASGSVDLPKSPTDYTVLVYMVGSDLETNYSCATRDLAEMLEAQVDPQRANVVVYTGGSQRWHANIPNDRNCVIDIASGHGKVAAATDRSLNMGDAATLASFVRWATENYPAEHTALVLWDHGGGPAGGYGFDQIYRFDSLSLDEMAEAMDDAGYGGEHKLDWVGFDACLMASVETMRAWQPYAECFVGSEDVEDQYGWDYSFLEELGSTNDARQVTTAAVDRFDRFHQQLADITGAQPNATLSAVDLSCIDAIYDALDGVSEAVLADFEHNDFSVVARARERCRSFGATSGSVTTGGAPLVDLGDLAERLAKGHEAEAAALSAAIDAAVYANSTNLTGAHGITLHFPLAEGAAAQVTPVTQAYGKMLDQYALQEQCASQESWSLPDLVTSGESLTLQLSGTQDRSLATASYAVLADFDGRGYVPIMTNVQIEPDETGLISIPADPQLVVSATDDAMLVPLTQTDASPERQVYRCSSAYLLPGSEYLDAPTGSEHVTLSLTFGPGEREVGVASVAADDGAATEGRASADLQRYRSLMLYLGGWQYPQRADDGTMLPFTKWTALSGNLMWYEASLEGELAFERRHVSELEGTFALQLVVSDVTGAQHASELVPLQSRTDRTATVATDAGRLTFLVEDDHAELLGYKGTDERLEIPAEVEGVPVTAVADEALSSDWRVVELTLPSTITSIGANALRCHAAERIELGTGLRSIGIGALCGCTNLRELELPEGLESIGRGALRRLGVESITLPASLSELGAGVLTSCESLQSIMVAPGCPSAQQQDGVLFSPDGRTLVAFPAGRTGSYTPPEGTETIGYGAFAATNLEAITLPEGVTAIENCAFYCASFGESSTLASISLPDSLRSVGAFAFGASMRTIYLEEGPAIEELHLGPNLEYVGPSAFSGLNLQRFVVDEANQTFSSPGGFLANKAGDTILEAPSGMGQVVVVPEGVTTVGKDVFALCATGTDFVLPRSLSRISVLAFPYHFDGDAGGADASRIYDISIHCDEGTAAAQFAERHKVSWDTVTDPDALSASRAVVEADGITLSFLVYGDHAVLHGIETSTYDADLTLAIPATVEDVPVTAIDACRESSVSVTWKAVVLPASLQGIDPEAIPLLTSREGFAIDGNGGTLTTVDGVLFGDGGTMLVAFALADPNPTDDEPFAYDVPVGTRTIGEGAFNSSALERVSLPSTLRMVRDRAFQWNYHLADIQISEGLERIGDRAFYCPATSITLPSTLTHLGDNALDLDGFEGLVLPERLKKVGSFVFHSFNGTFSTGSDTLHIGRKLSSIGQDTFDSLAITAFDVDPANKTFASVDGLLTTKDGKTLLRCPAGLDGELRIPEGIEHLEPGCLDVATGVTDVYFPASAVGVDAYHDFSDGSAARQVTFHCASGSAAALYAREHDIPWTEEGI